MGPPERAPLGVVDLRQARAAEGLGRWTPWGLLRALLAMEPDAILDLVSRLSALQWTRWTGAREVARARDERLATLVRFARERSALYRERLSGVPEDAPLERLPILTKREAMARFDEWVTDPEATRARIAGFLADRSRIGERFLGRYAAWKSSGTSGEAGFFLHDESAIATYHALIASRLQSPDASLAWGFGLVAHGGRRALVAATGEHFAGLVTWRALSQLAPAGDSCELSILRPVDEWVERLNAFQPAFLAGYPTALRLLAAEQASHRLAISPSILWSGGERLTPVARREIERAFGGLVIDEYGSSECLSIAASCPHGWLHLHADWVILEPVDAQHRPVAPGTLSHTALLTNLANRVQPILRYDIGDRVVVKPDPCACGSCLPALAVHGRADDVVTFDRPDGARVSLLPLALATAVEEGAGVHLFQLVRRSSDTLAVRLPDDPPRERRAHWRAVRIALSELLAAHGLSNVDVVLDPMPPIIDPSSGKLREVIMPPRDMAARVAAHERGAAGQS